MDQTKTRLLEEAEKWADTLKTRRTQRREIERTFRARQAINPLAVLTTEEEKKINVLDRGIAEAEARYQANRDAIRDSKRQMQELQESVSAGRKVHGEVMREAEQHGFPVFSFVESAKMAKRGMWSGYQGELRAYLAEACGPIKSVRKPDGTIVAERVKIDLKENEMLIPRFVIDPIKSYEKRFERFTEEATYYPSSGTGTLRSTSGSGGELMMTNYDYSRIVGPHFASDWMDRAGVPTVNEAYLGKTVVPAIASMSDVTLWSGEGEGVTIAANTTGNREYTYRYASWGYYITQLLKDTSPSEATAFLTLNLAEKAIKAKIAWAAVNGSGSSGQPTGLLNNANVTQTSMGTNGGAFSYDSLLSLWRDMVHANIEGEELCFLMNSNCIAKAATTPFISGGSEPIIRGPEGPIFGTRIVNCEFLPNNTTVGTSSGICSTMAIMSPLAMLRFLYGPMRLAVDDVVANGATMGVLTQPYDVGVHDYARIKVMTGITTSGISSDSTT